MESVSLFDYSSPFSYERINDYGKRDDDANHHCVSHFDDQNHDKYDDFFQKIIYKLIVSISTIFLVLTFPITLFFCLHRVPSLKRCIIYRLGRRLSMKNPGYIILLPFIDKFTIIDVNDLSIELIKNNEQLMTQDGSIIMIQKSFVVKLMITNVILNINNKVNIEKLLRLSFKNFLHSKHVEDLENKCMFNLKEFEEKINIFLKQWGYAINLNDQEPLLFTTIDRSDPLNPIKKKIMNVLKQESSNNDSNQTNEEQLWNKCTNLFENYFQAQSNNDDRLNDLDQRQVHSQQALNDDTKLDYQLIAVIQTFYNQYKNLLNTKIDDNFILKIIINDNSIEKLFICQKDGHIRSLDKNESKQLNMTIVFNNIQNFQKFLLTHELKYLQFKLH